MAAITHLDSDWNEVAFPFLGPQQNKEVLAKGLSPIKVFLMSILMHVETSLHQTQEERKLERTISCLSPF